MNEPRGAARRDALDLREALARHHCQTVFHWAFATSLTSILRLGIRPQRYLLQHRIPFRRRPHSYGLDPILAEVKERELGGHVGVSFRPLDGMYRGYSDAVVLELASDVLLADGAFFSP